MVKSKRNRRGKFPRSGLFRLEPVNINGKTFVAKKRVGHRRGNR